MQKNSQKSCQKSAERANEACNFWASDVPCARRLPRLTTVPWNACDTAISACGAAPWLIFAPVHAEGIGEEEYFVAPHKNAALAFARDVAKECGGAAALYRLECLVREV